MNIIGTIIGLMAALFYGLYDYMSIGDASIYNPMVKTFITSAITSGILFDVFRHFFLATRKASINQE